MLSHLVASVMLMFLFVNHMHTVSDLLHWRDVKKSGIAFVAGLVVLLSLACCSIISVISYVALLALSASLSFRVYKSVLQAVQKTNEGHPFK